MEQDRLWNKQLLPIWGREEETKGREGCVCGGVPVGGWWWWETCIIVLIPLIHPPSQWWGSPSSDPLPPTHLCTGSVCIQFSMELLQTG